MIESRSSEQPSAAGTAPRRITEVIVPVRSQRIQKGPDVTRRIMPRALAGLIIAGVLVLLVGVAIVAAITVTHTHTTGEQEVEQIKTAVGRHYLLPASEQPALATVTDETQLTSPFLKQAKNGDKLLIYADAKIVVIYRPSIDRVVAVGPVEITPQPPAGQ